MFHPFLFLTHSFTHSLSHTLALFSFRVSSFPSGVPSRLRRCWSDNESRTCTGNGENDGQKKGNERPVKKYDGFRVRLTASRTLSAGVLLLTPPTLLRSPVFASPRSTIYLFASTFRSLSFSAGPEKSDRLIFTGRLLDLSSNSYDLRSGPLMSRRFRDRRSHYGTRDPDVFQFTSSGVY